MNGINLFDLIRFYSFQIKDKMIEKIMFGIIDVDQTYFNNCNETVIQYIAKICKYADQEIHREIGMIFLETLTNKYVVALQSTVVQAPREVILFKCILYSFTDISDQIRARALKLFLSSFIAPNGILRQLVSEIFKNPKKFIEDKPLIPIQLDINNFSDDSDTIITDNYMPYPFMKPNFVFLEGMEDLYDVDVMQVTINLWNAYIKTQDANIRKVIVEIVTHMIIRDRDIVRNHEIKTLIKTFTYDRSPVVKQQAITMYTKMIDVYPIDTNILQLYIERICEFVDDRDQAVVKAAVTVSGHFSYEFISLSFKFYFLFIL